MMILVTPEEMRRLESETEQSGCSYEAMMENAGAALAARLQQLAQSTGMKSLLFLCGTGNNAGDCFVAARLLSSRMNITLCLVNGLPKSALARKQFEKLQGISILTSPEEMEQAVRREKLIVDGVFGIGFHGELPPFIQSLFKIIEESADKKCIAVDIPSGGDGQNGAVSAGTPHCMETVTFGAAKVGMFFPPLLNHCGVITTADIGIPKKAFSELDSPVQAIDERYVREALPKRPLNGHKGMFGRLLCVVGSRNMPGAGMIAVRSAARCGVGTLCVGSEISTCRMIVSQTPEAMMLPLPADEETGILKADAASQILDYAKSCTAVLIGCGLGQSDSLKKLVKLLIENLEIPMVLDADGLNAIASDMGILHRAKNTVILTPNLGEMSRMMHCTVEALQRNRLAMVRQLSADFPNTVVVLKDAGTLISKNNRTALSCIGNSGMSKGGCGDMLAGMVASFTAQRVNPEDAAKIAVYFHGQAGVNASKECSMRAMLPTDMIHQIPKIFLHFESQENG